MNPFPEMYVLRLLLVVLMVAAMIDLRTFKIPNLITLPFAAGALTYYGVLFGHSGLLFSLSGFGIGLLILLVPYALGGLGGGDVKLLGMVGAFLGPKAVVSSFFYIAIVGGAYATSVLLVHCKGFRSFFDAMQTTIYDFILTRKILPGSAALRDGRPRLKYGLAIAFGTGLFIVTQTNGYTF
jgi:prepilin peptidase CpaA